MWYNNNELKHYGVLGMRWGVRKEYEPKGRLTKPSRKEYSKNKPTRKLVSQKNPKRDPVEKDKQQRKGLTDKQKKYIKIGAIAVGTALVAYGGYQLYKSGKLDGLINKGKESLMEKGVEIDGPIDTNNSLNRPKKLSAKPTIQQVIEVGNPSKYRNNCYNQTVDATLRLCGFSTKAKGDTQNGKGLDFEDLCKVFKLNDNDIKSMTDPSTDKITKYIGRKFSEGDVGAITVTWNGEYKKLHKLSPTEPVSHVLNWVVENGKVQLFDTQAEKGNEHLTNFFNKYLDSEKEVMIAKFANRSKELNLDSDIDLNELKKFVDFVE